MASPQSTKSRLDNATKRVKPVDLFSSLKLELSALIVCATAIAFAMCWFLLKFGWSGWIAMPLTLVVALGITYFFSRGITAPLRQMRDVAEAMAEGDYTVRVNIDQERHDEVGQLARSFNEMAEELEHADKMRLDMIANVSHELRTPVSALQAMVENMADGVTEPTPANLEGHSYPDAAPERSYCLPAGSEPYGSWSRQSEHRAVQRRRIPGRNR